MTRFKHASLILILIGAFALFPRLGHCGEVAIDALSFKSTDGRSYLELYLDLPRSILLHQKDSIEWVAYVSFEVGIYSDTVRLASDIWRVDDVASSAESVASNQRIVDARIYEMPPGTYRVRLTVTDSLAQRRIEEERWVNVSEFPEAHIGLSSIELSAYVVPSSVHPRFDKGEYGLVPNPRRLFSLPGPIYYYFEVYPPGQSREDEVTTITRVLSSAMGDTITRSPIFERTGNTAFSEVDTIGIGGLPTGTYRFSVSVNTKSGASTERGVKFFLLGNDSAVAITMVPRDSSVINREFAEVEYLLRRDLQDAPHDLNVTDKATLLDVFWRRYDDDPRTPEIPLRRAFHSRVLVADEMFANSRTPGHKTERGRVYSLYGEPSDREVHPIDTNAKPYEIWSYSHIQGGVEFIFVDRTGMGEYSLVHSTLRGEVFNPEWYSLYVTRSGLETQK